MILGRLAHAVPRRIVRQTQPTSPSVRRRKAITVRSPQRPPLPQRRSSQPSFLQSQSPQIVIRPTTETSKTGMNQMYFQLYFFH